jgi:hypothetical protein
MRHLPTSAAALAGASLLLAACTSEGPDTAEPDVVTLTSAPGPAEAGTASDTGWYCALIEEELVATATNGALDRARESMVSNDDDAWVCEVNLVAGDSYETVLRLSVYPNGQEETDAFRAELADAEGMERGPAFLGESYVVPGRTVALMQCNLPELEGQPGGPGPYAFQIEGLSGPAAELTEELRSPVRRLVTQIDQSVGCFPTQAYESAPTDGG